MSFTDLLAEAFRAIRSHALRSFLTLLGIIIGVTTIVGVVSVITGLNAFVRDKVFSLAPDAYVVTKFGIIQSREEFLEALKRKDIEYREYEVLARELHQARRVAAEATTSTAVKFRERRLADVTLHGTTAAYGEVTNLELAAGRYFAEHEDRAAVPLVVIGWDIKQELFPHLDPIGRTILVGGLPCRVVGLMAQQGSALGQTRDNHLYMPYQAFRRAFDSRASMDLYIQAAGGVEGVNSSLEEARAVFRALRHTSFRSPDPFGVVTAESLQTLWKQISSAAFMLLVLISSVSLGIGGIVIMNIMLVSVLERTQEIGVRKAIGARPEDIRRQFLLESALLSGAGGLVGTLAGGAIALWLNQALSVPAQFSPGIMFAGLGLSLVVGLLAGFLPALNASRLQVVEALRAE
ncbi:MAG: ABC transporter permease [Acidobacteria bacterium]|nr:ABC transporter permease [Acidobacteriota bacterium]